MYEMKTAHRIYCLDEHLKCIHVCEREDRQLLPEHSLIGSRLLGGKLDGESGEVAELSHPLPRRGASAVFERSVGRRVALAETSPVEDILLRLRVVDVKSKPGARVWRQVTGKRDAKSQGQNK